MKMENGKWFIKECIEEEKKSAILPFTLTSDDYRFSNGGFFSLFLVVAERSSVFSIIPCNKRNEKRRMNKKKKKNKTSSNKTKWLCVSYSYWNSFILCIWNDVKYISQKLDRIDALTHYKTICASMFLVWITNKKRTMYTKRTEKMKKKTRRKRKIIKTKRNSRVTWKGHFQVIGSLIIIFLQLRINGL